jgi:hypothetical protein
VSRLRPDPAGSVVVMGQAPLWVGILGIALIPVTVLLGILAVRESQRSTAAHESAHSMNTGATKTNGRGRRRRKRRRKGKGRR